LAVAVLVAMASGIVVALGDVASLPAGIVIAAVAGFLGSIGVFGMLTYRDARSNDSTFRKALGQCLRTAGKVFVALLP
jgi:hypothetical protein